MHYLYKIICLINNKIYIGQTVNPKQRWRQHKATSKQAKPEMIINRAMKKHGIENFTFEVIATCRSYEDANETETALVEQYDCYVSNGKGYNGSLGGSNAPKTDEWKKKLSDWHASLTPEEKEARGVVARKNLLKYFEENGHPCQGIKFSEERLAAHSIAMKNRNIEYTPELRAKLSISNKGKCLEPEQKARRIDALREAFKERLEEELANDEWKCHAPDCDVKGHGSYPLYNGVRYCPMHFYRLETYGTTDLPRDEQKAKEVAEGKWKCHAPGCNHDNDKRYWIYEGLRYCSMHFYRLDTFGSTELPKNVPNKRQIAKAKEIAEGKWKCHAADCNVFGGEKHYFLHDNLRYCPKHHRHLLKIKTAELPGQ